MLNIKRDIHSLSDFKRKTPEFVKQLERTGKPVILTMNGRAKIVVQGAESYQQMLEVLDRAEAIEAIRKGLESIEHGKTMSLEEMDETIRAKFDFPKAK